jgi:membrane-bound serine protease (ClpP class)
MPFDFAGLSLLALGIVLMLAETFTGIGALGLGGLAAFAAGSILLFDPDAARGVAYRVAWPVVVGATLASGLFLMFGLALALRARRLPVRGGPERIIGAAGTVLAWTDGVGTVRVAGEDWSARSASPLHPGDAIRVVARTRLTLSVEPTSGS